MPEVAPIIKTFITQNYNEETTFDVTNVPLGQKDQGRAVFPLNILHFGGVGITLNLTDTVKLTTRNAQI